MPHDLLERLFVAREQLLDRIVDRVHAAAHSDERNHTLLVGPRGSGKTHLVSLVYYRTRKASSVAWLPEDPWTIVSYQRLLRAIAERVEPAFEEPLPSEAEELEGWLIHRAQATGPILVIVENLDQILSALGNEGQQWLRHLLQAHRPFLLVATSTRLDRSLSEQASPFYGFFTTTRLEPLDTKQAAAMLSAIASENGDGQLVDYLASDEGQRRLQTIAHLAGGQPRIWALLASALDVAKLDELIDLLLSRFDDLTPYYQEQLARLSPQQRLIVAELADTDRPINVTRLARRLDIDQRSLSKTISDLVERGWVMPIRSKLTSQLDRRRTYYELAEPLARVSFQLKEARGEPVKVVVEFLKHWFDPSQLDLVLEDTNAKYISLATAGQDTDSVVAVTRQLNRLPRTRAPAVELLGEIDDALADLADGDPEPLLRLPTPIRTALEGQLDSDGVPALRERVHEVAWAEFGRIRQPEMDPWIARAERWISSQSAGSTAQLMLTGWLARTWRFDEALQASHTTTQMLGREHVRTWLSRTDLASDFSAAGMFEEAIPVFEEAIAELERLLSMDHELVLAASHNLAHALESAGRRQEALTRYERSLAGLQHTYGPEHPFVLASCSNIAMLYSSEGRTAEAVALQEETVSAAVEVLGPADPDAFNARITLGVVYERAGSVRSAATVLEGVLVDLERSTGPKHLRTVITRDHLARVLVKTNQVTEATRLYGMNVAATEEILGADHPFSEASRERFADALNAAAPSPPTDPTPAPETR